MIIPMKKAHIVVFKEDKENLLTSLQKYRVLMVIDSDTKGISNQGLIERSEKSITFLTDFAKIKKPMGFLNETTYDELMTFDPKRVDLLNEIESLQQEIINAKNDILHLQNEINILNPWEELDFIIEETNNLRYANFHIGYIEQSKLNSAILILENAKSQYKLLGLSNDLGQAIYYFNYLEDEEAVMDEMRAVGFQGANLNYKDRLINEAIGEKKTQIENGLMTINNCEAELLILSKQIKEIEILNDQLNSFNETGVITGNETLETTVITGWVRSDKIKRLETAINAATDIFDLELLDSEEGENPPVAVKNHKLVEPFESVTDMFSSPGEADIDPNPVMSFWFWLIFGIMMGDAGYGVVIIILFALLIKVMKPQGESVKLFKMLMYGGVSTIFWGVMFGSYFGATWNPILIEPMAEPLTMLIYSLIVGVAHIITALLTMAYKNYKNKDYWAILFDQFSWIFLLLGICFIALPALKNVGLVLIIIGAGTVLLFGGRKNKGIFGKISGGLGGLYGITGYMSDILSYSRLLALVLSSAVVAMVMNMLAGMIQGSVIGFILSIFVYIVGHAFNIIMGMLSAYVHDSRLQYIEFFGKFYDGGGEKFDPLSLKLNHIKKVNL